MRSDRAWSLKRNFYGLWTECWRYAAPGIDPYRATGGYPEMMQPGSQGQPRYEHLYDATLARDAQELADSVIARAFPAGQQWAQLEQGPTLGAAEQQDGQMNALMEDVGNAVFEAIHASNFPLAATSMALDAIVSGTG